LPIAEFLETHFGGRQYDELRRRITRTVEGYDAADPRRASTLALRAEWLAEDEELEHGRLNEGYGALIDHLASECRRRGAVIHLGAAAIAVAETGGQVEVRCADGRIFGGDAAILTAPLPVLAEIALPGPARKRAAAAADIGFGNVVKFLFRFETAWWRGRHRGEDLRDLSFMLSDAKVPTWWTQQPAVHPVLTGWFAGPRADRVSALGADELVAIGIASLAEIFEVPAAHLRAQLVAGRAIDWGRDPFARGAYSYATPQTRAAQRLLGATDSGGVFFAGEALYEGPDMGTVEAALASGHDVVQALLGAGR
jgi:monoamine oxidase